MSQALHCDCNVVIVGAGVSGASAAYHLMEAGVENLVVIDEGPAPGEGTQPRRSGTAVMKEAPAVKMMVQLFSTDSEAFIRHHGEDGAKRYLSLTGEGVAMQKALAKKIFDSTEAKLHELGSFCVGYEHDEEALRKEFDVLKNLGCEDIEWYNSDKLRGVNGCSSDFHCAIFFPSDAIIDSSSYAKALLKKVESRGVAHVVANKRVTEIFEKEEAGGGKAFVELESGSRIVCNHVVVATGGLFQMKQLCGLLKPCYSYLVHVPITTINSPCDYSSNFFTWGYSHDWCFTGGRVRCSGEDHFSAYKSPLVEERCANLTRWTLKKYGVAETEVEFKEIPQQYGVYSETPDYVPLVGHMNTKTRICLLLGCNAWGQAVLSYSASLVPGLLGYNVLTADQRDNLKLLSVRRFCRVPATTEGEEGKGGGGGDGGGGES